MTYYVVAHFHYVLSMGAVFALFSAWYFWVPKILGLEYSVLKGRAHFWVMFLGVNVTFFPQHFLGLQGMPRRISDYPDGFAGWNMVSSVGSIISVAATWLFLYILYTQLVFGKAASRFTWLTAMFYGDSLQTLLNRAYSSLEWNLVSPPKPHAFDSLPVQSFWSNFPDKPDWEERVKRNMTQCLNCLHRGVVSYISPPGLCPKCGNNSATYDGSNNHEKSKKGNGDKSGKKMILFILVLGLYALSCTVILTYLAVGLNTDTSFSLLTKDTLLCDAPRPWGIYFQDSASPQMEALIELHDNIMFYLVIILFSVGWILAAIAIKYSKPTLSSKFVSHGTLVELIWTVSPGLILVFIAFTSFKLLYLMDEVSDVNMTFYIEGHQWYWSYQYPDFIGDDGDFIEYDSYLVPESDLENGALRMLDVDERVIIPEVTHARFIVSSGDVIHSYACPSLGIKADAYPGRLNQASSLINRLGTFYGQCSEICGILHTSMPITIQSITLEKFLVFLWEK